MIQKMPTDNNICKLCKDIAGTIPKMEEMIVKLQRKYERAIGKLSASQKMSADELQAQIDEYTHYLQSLQAGYTAILGVEYGSEQTHEAYKPQMKEYVFCTLHRRGYSTRISSRAMIRNMLDSTGRRSWNEQYFDQKNKARMIC